MNEFGNKIKEKRKERRILGNVLAEMLSITPVYLCRIESGKQIPSIQLLDDICLVLDLDFVEMVKIADYPEKVLNEVIKKRNDMIEEILSNAQKISYQDLELLSSLVRKFSNLKNEEKDIIRYILKKEDKDES